MSDELARKLFTGLKRRTDPIPDTELDEFWATLAPATIDDMLGDWCGGAFDTGHRMNGLLAKAKWFGKRFSSATDVQPLICLDNAGERQARQG